jgi:hypothetical protein
MRLISRWFRILPRLKPGFQTKRGIQRTPYISSYFHDLWLPDSGPWPYHPNLYYTNALPDTPNLYKRTSATLKRNIFTAPFRGLVASNPANPLQSAVRGCNTGHDMSLFRSFSSINNRFSYLPQLDLPDFKKTYGAAINPSEADDHETTVGSKFQGSSERFKWKEQANSLSRGKQAPDD